jgi:hypothetical protein
LRLLVDDGSNDGDETLSVSSSHSYSSSSSWTTPRGLIIASRVLQKVANGHTLADPSSNDLSQLDKFILQYHEEIFKIVHSLIVSTAPSIFASFREVHDVANDFIF